MKAIVVVILPFFYNHLVLGFQLRVPQKKSTEKTLLHLNFIDFEGAMFKAQSSASNMVSLSLEKPSNIAFSVPIMYAAGLLTGECDSDEGRTTNITSKLTMKCLETLICFAISLSCFEAFSPCVWGLLPLTVSYISNAAGERKDRKIILPTLSFAFGLALVFCSFGILAATGGAVYGNVGILPIFSNLICCLMAFQLFDFISLPAFQTLSPSSTIKKSQNDDELILIDSNGKIMASKSDTSNSNIDGEQGSLFRTFLLGGSSALVASPCATPVLTSILAFVANSSNPLLGGFLLLFYTLGYSTPLLVTAATGGRALIELKDIGGKDESSIYARIAPWVSPATAGILLWYGTDGLLTVVLGDPSMAGLLALS